MRLRRRPAEPTLAIDPCMGDQQARRFLDALTSADWPTAREILARTDHPDDRAFLLDVGGSAPGVQHWIGSVAGDDPLAQLVRGCHAVAWAWEARGAYGAQYTQREQFRLFFERLRTAETCLYDVVARTPDEPVAWAFLVRTARGLQLPLEDGEFRFRQAIERHSTNLKAHHEWMQTQCEKWSGSHDQMHRFARDAAGHSPDGSMLHALIPLAHLEVLIHLEGTAARLYVTRPNVQEDLRIAAGLSIWHPAAEFRPGWPVYLNTFAVAFSQAGDRPAAKAVFDRLGDQVTGFPWGYLGGNPAANFLKARTATG
jgi:hypothetical protein